MKPFPKDQLDALKRARDILRNLDAETLVRLIDQGCKPNCSRIFLEEIVLALEKTLPKKQQQFVLFLREEPPKDSFVIKYPEIVKKLLFDVVAYKTPSADSAPVARWEWHLSTRPTRRRSKVVVNGYPYEVTWLDPKK